MKPVVAHFIRKSTQVKATFINAQIAFHTEFVPVVIYSAKSTRDDGGYANFDFKGYKYLNSGSSRTFIRKKFYDIFKWISRDESKSIMEFLSSNNVSILHLHYGSDAGIYWKTLQKSGIPSLVSFYGYDCSSFPKMYFGIGRLYLQQRVFRHATIILAMSYDMKNDLIALGCPKEKILVHYYGTDTQKLEKKKTDRKTGNNITILTAGRLDEKKGHLFLLESLRLFLSENSSISIKWIIAGSGKMQKKLFKCVETYNMSKSVKFIGAYKYGSDELNTLFSSADIYIQPSVQSKKGDKEGIPGTLVEAMAFGLPIISTFHAGIPEIVEDGISGILVKEWDIRGMAAAIKKLTENHHLSDFLAKNASKFAKENLDLKMKEKELESLYSVLRNKNEPLI